VDRPHLARVLVGLAFPDDCRAAFDRVAERSGLDVGDLSAEVVVQGKLRAGIDLDPAEDQGAVGGPPHAAGLGQGVANGGGFGLRPPEGPGQYRAEGEGGDEGERYEEVGAADAGTLGSVADGAGSSPSSAASSS